MKKTLILILLGILLLTSCNSTDTMVEKTTDVTTSDTNTTVGDTMEVTEDPVDPPYPATSLFEKPEPNEKFLAIKDRYSDEILHEMNYFDGTIDQFNERYPIEYQSDSKTGTSVIYLGENGKLIHVCFDENGKRYLIAGAALFSFSCSLYAFTAIQENMTYADVEKIDPNGTYYPLVGSGSNKLSVHYTPEGYCVLVHYKRISDPTVSLKERFLVVDVEITPF